MGARGGTGPANEPPVPPSPQPVSSASGVAAGGPAGGAAAAAGGQAPSAPAEAAEPNEPAGDGYVDYVELAQAAKRRKPLRQLPGLIGSCVRVVASAGRGVFALATVLQLIGGLIAAVQVLVTKQVLDALIAIQNGTQPVRHALTPVILLAAVTAVSTSSSAVLSQQQRLLSELTMRRTWQQILDVAGAVNLRSFESSSFYDELSRVQTNAVTRPITMTMGLIGLVGGLAGSIGLAAAIISLQPLLLPLLLLSGVPLWMTSRLQSRLEFNFVVAQTPRLRLRMYLIRILGDRDTAKELRAFNFGSALRKRFDGVYSDYLTDLRRQVRRKSGLAFVGSIASAVFLGATLVVLVWLVGNGHATLAEAGAAIIAIRLMSSQVATLFGSIQQISESSLFLNDYQNFLDRRPQAQRAEAGRKAPKSFERIEAEGLNFRYPGSQQDALHDVSLEIGAGEVIALVGENGSGKTTLAKLLGGLYEPDAGSIRWDDVDVREYDRSDLRNAIAVIFQDFVRYELTARENIGAGRPDRLDDAAGIFAAAKQAGADGFLSGLPAGYETILSKAYKGGRDLSLGQWQRVALARAFFRDAPFVILDEPSASLDPRAEHELFSRIRELLAGRTVLFISHRFSSVRSADRIYVMQDGGIVEHGTHEQLMANGRLYADLFSLQAAAYLDPTKSR